MCMPVEHQRDRVPANGLLETARSEERVDFERLAVNRPLDRRIVHERNQTL